MIEVQYPKSQKQNRKVIKRAVEEEVIKSRNRIEVDDGKEKQQQSHGDCKRWRYEENEGDDDK